MTNEKKEMLAELLNELWKKHPEEYYFDVFIK